MEKICKEFRTCGGCQYLDIDYETQLQNKTKYLQDLLNENGIKAKAENTVGLYYPYEYRNKVHISVNKSKGRTYIGFCEENSNKVINVNHCLLHENWVDKLFVLTKRFLNEFNILPYDKQNKTGQLRYIVARKLGKSLQVTMVVANQNFAGKEWFYEELKKLAKDVSFYININNRSDNFVFGDKFIYKFGSKKLTHNLLGINFILSPDAFFQVNEKIASKMYLQAQEELKNSKTIIDLYSGIGITSNLFAKNGANVISIEYNKSAVNDCRKIIELNNLQDKIKVYCGKCEDIIENIEIDERCSMFVDPARDGLDPKVIEAIKKINPQKIVYMSCNPTTLVRDIKLLLMQKYKLKYIKPYDMFPQTEHLETLVCLEYDCQKR